MPNYPNPFGVSAAGGPFDVVTTPAAVYTSKISATTDAPVTAPTLDLNGLAVIDNTTWQFVGGTDLSRYKGVQTLMFDASYKKIPSGGIPGTIKVVRTDESYGVKFGLYRTTLQELQYVLNGNAITTTAASTTAAATSKIKLQQGLFIQPYSLVVLTASPYGPYHSMLYIPRVVNMQGSQPAYQMDDGASIELQFDAILEPSLTFPDQYGYRIDVTAPHS